MPSASGTTPTITVGDLKTRIAEVTSELAEAATDRKRIKTCVTSQARIRTKVIRYFQGRRAARVPCAEDRSPQDSSARVWTAGRTRMLHQSVELVRHCTPTQKARTWIEGTDAALFSVVQGEATPDDDVNRDGSPDCRSRTESEYMENFADRATAPLPGGEYKIDRKEVWIAAMSGLRLRSQPRMDRNRHDAPEGTLHEAFFDPVTDGTAVAADGTNGVLKPATFTGADGASATIERIEWESGTVKLEVSPDDALAGHVLDFIELDGTTSLSLHADQATVDAGNDTLSWSVGSQPWEDGDELMVRVRRSTPASETAPVPTSIPTSVPTPTPLPVPSPGLSYLTEEIPPCTPIPGSSADPCEPRAEGDAAHQN